MLEGKIRSNLHVKNLDTSKDTERQWQLHDPLECIVTFP